jgi:hypothetical protein
MQVRQIETFTHLKIPPGEIHQYWSHHQNDDIDVVASTCPASTVELAS